MRRYIPLAVFLAVSAIGLGMAAVVYRAELAAEVARFAGVADETIDRLRERINQHEALLVATRGLFTANDGRVSRKAFAEFVEGLELDTRYAGVQGIGFAQAILTGNERDAKRSLSLNYDLDRDIFPGTEQDIRTPIVLLEPSNARNFAALGYDMFADATRRIAMRAAEAAEAARASGPVELVQEITAEKQAGFLLYLPYKPPQLPAIQSQAAPMAGFVYAAFRAGDLHRAALARSHRLPVAVETFDITGGEPQLVHRDENFGTATNFKTIAVERQIEIAGRIWRIDIQSTQAFSRANRMLGTLALASIAIFLAAALAALTYAQMRTIDTARRLQVITEKSVQDKDMLLQEMKHRIKNLIARVSAMARQTASNSDDLDDFVQSFSARLQAMSNAQDVLTRSRWGQADLKELLSMELGQVFGENLDGAKISGPEITLDEVSTQALGLTFHELATNALKYGNLVDADDALKVTWRASGPAEARVLDIDWRETATEAANAPTSTGFGTRLIDATIRGELRGSIERDFSDKGMAIRIRVPLPKQARKAKKRRKKS